MTKLVTDYQAIQYDVEYIPNYIQEKVIEYMPVERVAEKVEYQAIQTQNILSYVSSVLTMSPGLTTTTICPDLIHPAIRPTCLIPTNPSGLIARCYIQLGILPRPCYHYCWIAYCDLKRSLPISKTIYPSIFPSLPL